MRFLVELWRTFLDILRRGFEELCAHVEKGKVRSGPL